MPPTLQRITPAESHHFFGYYDKSPWDASGRWLLGLEASFMDRPPSPGDAATIGLIDSHDHFRWTPLARSRAWNWQQGCMLQWLGGGPEVIFNDREGDRFISRILNIHSGAQRKLPRPVYTVTPDGRLAASLNFSRLHHQRPGYGYAGVPDPWRHVAEPEDDGIYTLDLQTGASRLILSTREAACWHRKPDFDGAIHRFNHLQFSRDGKSLGFLHRYRKEPGGHQSRLMTLAPDGTQCRCVSDHDMVSHYDWHPSGAIVAWARRHGIGDAYFLFPPHEENGNQEPRTLGQAFFDGDGHCSFSPCGSWLLTDTYPDASGHQSLLLHRWETGEPIPVAGITSLRLPDEIRCDLHPRWSRDGRKICIDSTHEGSRQIYVLEPAELRRDF